MQMIAVSYNYWLTVTENIDVASMFLAVSWARLGNDDPWRFTHAMHVPCIVHDRSCP